MERCTFPSRGGGGERIEIKGREQTGQNAGRVGGRNWMGQPVGGARCSFGFRMPKQNPPVMSGNGDRGVTGVACCEKVESERAPQADSRAYVHPLALLSRF